MDDVLLRNSFSYRVRANAEGAGRGFERTRKSVFVLSWSGTRHA